MPSCTGPVRQMSDSAVAIGSQRSRKLAAQRLAELRTGRGTRRQRRARRSRTRAARADSRVRGEEARPRTRSAASASQASGCTSTSPMRREQPGERVADRGEPGELLAQLGDAVDDPAEHPAGREPLRHIDQQVAHRDHRRDRPMRPRGRPRPRRPTAAAAWRNGPSRKRSANASTTNVIDITPIVTA